MLKFLNLEVKKLSKLI